MFNGKNQASNSWKDRIMDRKQDKIKISIYKVKHLFPSL
jgi:hypothetical protein